MDALSSGRLHQTGQDAVGFQATIRSGPEAYLAEDHQMPERLFRVIVRGRYAGTPEEGEEKFLFGSCEIGPEDLGGFDKGVKSALDSYWSGGRSSVHSVIRSKRARSRVDS